MSREISELDLDGEKVTQVSTTWKVTVQNIFGDYVTLQIVRPDGKQYEQNVYVNSNALELLYVLRVHKIPPPIPLPAITVKRKKHRKGKKRK